jgi:NAD(P)-dependent dehydrogenase (short-subunit alcohol dehydrogenase family)
MVTLSALGQDYRALVIGASGGIGSAFAAHLQSDPRCGTVVQLSRTVDGLDVTDEVSVARQAAHLAGQEFEVVICATGALSIEGTPPEKSIRAVDPDAMARQFALNAIGPALLLKHFCPLLPRRGRSIFAILSAKVGSIGDNRLGGWISYRAAKAALNQIVRTSAIEVARSRPEAVLAALHPGTVATPLSAGYSPGHEVFSPADSTARMLATLDSLAPAQSGGFFAYDGAALPW